MIGRHFQQPTDVGPAPLSELPAVDGDAPATLPDIIVNNIPATSHALLTQPVATVIAGTLAIIAAGIAFAGVRYAQKVAIASSKATLRVQSVAALRQQRQHEAQLDATAELERSKHRREVEYTALSAAMNATLKARDAMVSYARYVSQHDGRYKSELRNTPFSVESTGPTVAQSAQAAVEDAVARAAALLMLAHEDAYLAMMDFTAVCRESLMEGSMPDPGKIATTSVAAIDQIRKAYKP